MDMGASVIARLKNKAKETGKPFQLHLQLFCQEEFLRRLAASCYAENLVLKGGLFIYTLTNFESRATVDIDFLLQQFPGRIEDIKRMVDEIISVDSGNDFITFTSRGFETISPQRKYTGVSFQLVGQIKNTRTPFDVDFGVGDIIIPVPRKRTIPVQLDGFGAPEVLTYSLESTIAEKFDALLQRLELTSRMKDIYDIYYLSSIFDFDGWALQQAIFETLQNRGTAYELDSFDRVIALAGNKDIQVRWRQYLRRLKMTELPLEEVMVCIDRFLRPACKHIIAAGIKRVVYIEPYPKSKAFDFYTAEISDAVYNDRKVVFEPFTGVGPQRFMDLFAVSSTRWYARKRKNKEGQKLDWKRETAELRNSAALLNYLDAEQTALLTFEDETVALKGEHHE